MKYVHPKKYTWSVQEGTSKTLSFWKGLKCPACVWQWLWHQFATFVSTFEGVKVLHKPGPAHPLYLPTHPFIGLATAAFPPVQLPAISVLFPHVAHNQHTQCLSDLWDSLHVLCETLCNFQVVYLRGSNEAKVVAMGVLKRAKVCLYGV